MSSSIESSSGAVVTRESSADVLAPAMSGGWLGRVLPWVVTLAVLGWLLWPYRAAEGRAMLMHAFGDASPWMFAVAALGVLAAWLTDSYATSRTFQRWGTELSLKDTSLIRGSMAMFDVINPALGQAVLTLVVYRRGTPLPQALIVVLLMNLIFVQIIALVAGAGLLAGAAPEGGIIPVLVTVSIAMAVVYLIVIALRPAWLAKNSTAAWLMSAGLSGHAWAFLYRLPNIVAVIAMQVLFLRCFGIDLPLAVALFYLPAVLFIVGMPISVQGLGPGQVAAVAFFAAYAQGDRATAEAAVLASSLASTVLTTLLAALLGLGCMATKTGRSSLAMLRKK